MKILMVNKFLYPNGGSETYMFELANQLTAMGHQVEYFGMYDERNIVGPAREDLVGNIDFHGKGLKKILYPFKILYSLEAKRKMRRVLRVFRPDIVHINNYNYQLTPSILYAKELRNIPVVQTVHDLLMACPCYRMYDERTRQVCEKCVGRKYMRCVKERCFDGSFAKSLLGALEGTLYKWRKTYEKKIDCYIFPSAFLHERISYMGVKLQNARIMHNFARIDYDPATARKKDRVIFFGRLTRDKGAQTLLEAAELLPDVSFLVAGDGPYKEKMGDYPNVEYVGFKRGRELFELVGESLVSVYPSELNENCPLSVIESLMAGTPVIGARRGGTVELIREGEDGMLADAGDASMFAEKIRWFMDHRGEAGEYAKRGMQNAARFSIEAYCDHLLTLYREEIEKKTRRGA